MHNPFTWEYDEEERGKRSEEDRYDMGRLLDVPLKATGYLLSPLSILRYDPKRVADTWAVFEKLVEEV